VSRTLLAAVGSVGDPRTWSGTPYHLFAAAQPAGVLDEGLDLSVGGVAWSARRLLWNAASLWRGDWGGYQYTDAFMELLWRPVRDALPGNHVVNCVQLYPSSVAGDERVRRSYFLDQTLTQLFDGYGVAAAIRADVASDALRREADGYRSAHAVVVHSEWARRSVIGTEGVEPARVHVVVPGANLDAVAYDAWAASHAPRPIGRERTLRLAFVGRDPHRKGLDRLLAAVRLARAEGADLALDVIGTTEREIAAPLRNIPGVRWHGVIDKSRDPRAFFDLVGSAHVGCLVSRAEAGGIGLREYHALGLAVLGPDVGGSPDHVLSDASMLVEPGASEAEIAQLLANLATDPDRIDAMREVSWRRRQEVCWPASVARLREVLR
jgi:glycosyltransferase involved in cell wall biosynthesis